jgi:hypothetical protein
MTTMRATRPPKGEITIIDADLEPGDVIQIDPSNEMFCACFAVVEEVRDWGVIAKVTIPGRPPSEMPIRLATGDFVRIGEAAFVQVPQD